MKELDVFLKTVADGMKTMAVSIESLAEKLDTLAKAQYGEKLKRRKKSPARPRKKTAPKAASKKEKTITAADMVFRIIKRSRKGVDNVTLMEKTGFNQKKIANMVYALKKQGKIKSVRKGVYVKV
jgi:predicted Rossmann fold nucleotide-binding protein DprA/Smf involved in DNA uptake